MPKNNGSIKCYDVPAVKRAIEILNYIKIKEQANLSDVVRDLGIPKSSAYAVLLTLESGGLLRRAEGEGNYSLGLSLFELGRAAVGSVDFRKEALPIMQELVDEVKEACNLGVMAGNEAIYLEKIDSPHPVRLAAWPGKKIPLHCTAIGRALLIGQDQHSLENIVNELDMVAKTQHTITDKKLLLNELKQCRQQGYAIDEEEHELEVRCIAAPIRNHTGKAVAAISISGPVTRLTKERIPLIAPLLKKKCEELSALLGYQSKKNIN